MRGRMPGVTASAPTAAFPSSAKAPSSKVSVVPFQRAAPEAESAFRLRPSAKPIPAHLRKARVSAMPAFMSPSSWNPLANEAVPATVASSVGALKDNVTGHAEAVRRFGRRAGIEREADGLVAEHERAGTGKRAGT